MKEITKYSTVAAIILLLDAVWIAGNYTMYKNAVHAVQRSDMVINYYATFIAYILVIFASIYIAIPFTKLHINKKDDMIEKMYKSFLYGGTVGLAVHGIYNCTSMAIYKNYSWRITLYDTIWGTFLHTVVVFAYLMM